MDKKNEDALAPDDEVDLEAVDLMSMSSSSSSSSGEEEMIRLRVQHQGEGAYSSLEVTTSLAKSTVYTLKERVREALGPAARGRYLRLIGHGRLLAPDSASLEGFRLMDGDCLHAVLAAPGIRYVHSSSLFDIHVSTTFSRVSPRTSCTRTYLSFGSISTGTTTSLASNPINVTHCSVILHLTHVRLSFFLWKIIGIGKFQKMWVADMILL
jgi:hypothetical protein